MSELSGRVILHCDCNSFFASCEAALNPSLGSVPMAVCGDPENRHGIILAKNELAKKFNIQTAETVYSAKRKCPDLVLVKSHHSLYGEFSKKCNAIYAEYTDMVEPFGIDESWLDVTKSRLLFGSGKDIADAIRKRFRTELGITCSVGVSFNKSIAKLASDLKKPDATTVITPENFKKTVWCMPVSALLYVGKNTETALSKMCIFTIGDLARADKHTIVKRLGKNGGVLHDYANGIDFSPVKNLAEKHSPKSVSNGMTFRRDLTTLDDIKKGVLLVTQELSLRLRKNGVKCSGLSVTVKYFDFTSVSRQKTYGFSFGDVPKILAEHTCDIIFSSFDLSKPVRSITVSGTHLVSENGNGEQLSMFKYNSASSEKLTSLEKALESIRSKYGESSVELGTFIDCDL